MNNFNKDVSVIIINYNSCDYTLACVNSILQFTSSDIDYEIVIIDNNSQSHDFSKLKDILPQDNKIKLIRSKLNLGFSGGNMFGLQFTDARYILFINSDCVLMNDMISILYSFMLQNPSVGVSTGQMHTGDQKFHHSFNYFADVKLKLFGTSPLNWISPKTYPDKRKHYESPIRVPSITGSAMFVNANKYAEIGGFDTNYFLYCEEEDLCFRLKKFNYSTYLVPDAKFIHHIGKSTVRNYQIEREYYISLLYFFRKHYSMIEYIILKGLFFIKNCKKFYKSIDYLKLAWFVIRGAPMRKSLRFVQKINFDQLS